MGRGVADNGAVTDGRARALKQRTHCMVKEVAKEWISTQLVERGRGDTVNRCGSNAKLGQLACKAVAEFFWSSALTTKLLPQPQRPFFLAISAPRNLPQ